MPNLFTENTSKTIILPKNCNQINYSILKEFYSPTPFRSFSIKYVVEGSELYSVNGTKHIIKNKQYLLANKFSEGFVEIDSKKLVTGICIDVAPDILSEVVASYLIPDAAVSDLSLDTFFNTPTFFENKYKAHQTHVGHYLLKVEKIIKENPNQELNFTKEFYFSLSEKIIVDHIPLFKQFQSVKAIKTETKKDLLRKILKAKDYIDNYFTDDFTIEKIAQEIGMSEYHFFRTFKSVFNLSPQQYVIKMRLNNAKKLLEKRDSSISAIAAASGFSDIYSFSKTFKKQFGYSPSNYFS